MNRIRAPDVVAESADTIPGPKDTDVAHTKSEGKILQIFPAIKDGVLQRRKLLDCICAILEYNAILEYSVILEFSILYSSIAATSG